MEAALKELDEATLSNFEKVKEKIVKRVNDTIHQEIGHPTLAV